MMSEPVRISRMEHDKFISIYAQLPRIDFMIVSSEQGCCVGGVNLSLTARGLEIGKYIGDSRFLGRGIAKQAMLTFIDVLGDEFSGCEIIARTKRANEVNIALNKRSVSPFSIMPAVNSLSWGLS